jgi:hypothetical protein
MQGLFYQPDSLRDLHLQSTSSPPLITNSNREQRAISIAPYMYNKSRDYRAQEHTLEGSGQNTNTDASAVTVASGSAVATRTCQYFCIHPSASRLWSEWANTDTFVVSRWHLHNSRRHDTYWIAKDRAFCSYTHTLTGFNFPFFIRANYVQLTR